MEAEFVLWASIISLILACFGAADQGLGIPKQWVKSLFQADERSRESLSPGGWAETFAGVFDQLFSKRHLSLTCYRRSLALSTGTVLCISIYILLGSEKGGTGFTDQFSPFTTLQFWTFAILINGTIDYFSLLETRYLVARMAKARSAFTQIALLLFDVLATLAVYVLGLHLFLLLFDPIYGKALQYFNSVAEGGPKSGPMFVISFHVFHFEQNILSILANGRDVAATIFGVNEGTPFLKAIFPGEGFNVKAASEIFFATTFMTSFFLWLYGFSVISLRLLAASSPIMSRIRSIFHWQSRPILSLGIVATVIFSIMFWVWVHITT